MNKARKEEIASHEVSELVTHTLGGHEQKVLYDGRYRANPIAIILHGGPGSPVPFSVGCRGLFPEFTDNFIMVYWDQLGCGINDREIDESFTIEDYVAMTLDLIKEVHHKYPDNQINLVGVSWGSILAAEAAVRVPESIGGVVISGQVVKGLGSSEETLEALQKADLSEKDRQKLRECSEKSERSKNDTMFIAKLLRKHTEGYQSDTNDKLPLASYCKEVFASPDYRFKDFLAVFVNGCQKNESLYEELSRVDLSDTLEKITVPYQVFQGEDDLVTPTKTMKDLVARTTNENIKLTVIERSSHIPGTKAMDEILKGCKKLFG